MTLLKPSPLLALPTRKQSRRTLVVPCKVFVICLKSTAKATSVNMLLPCVVLFSLLTLCSPVLSECWNYDGTNRNEDSDVKEGVILYEACDRTQPFSMCCRQPGEGDECRLDGLCQGFAGDGSRPVWRESCTDRTWDSPYCLDLCVDGRTEDGFPCTYALPIRLRNVHREL